MGINICQRKIEMSYSYQSRNVRFYGTTANCSLVLRFERKDFLQG